MLLIQKNKKQKKQWKYSETVKYNERQTYNVTVKKNNEPPPVFFKLVCGCGQGIV